MAECTDIDECGMDIKFCGDLHCINNVGSYTCGCRPGFNFVGKLYGGETHCADIDECLNRNSCPTNAVCQNTPGSFICKCNPGYQGDLCEDDDECTDAEKVCDTNADCLNTKGTNKKNCYFFF